MNLSNDTFNLLNGMRNIRAFEFNIIGISFSII